MTTPATRSSRALAWVTALTMLLSQTSYVTAAPPLRPNPPALSKAPPRTATNGVRVYAWSNTDDPIITNCVLLSQHETPATVLQLVEKTWRQLPKDRHCLVVAPWWMYQGPPFHDVSMRDLVLHGPDLTSSQRWWTSVLNILRQHNLQPSRVALDWETGMDYWNKASGRRPEETKLIFLPVWNDRRARAKLPTALRKFSPADFHWQRSRDAVIAWTQYARLQRRNVLRRTYVDPLHAVFPRAKITNYQDTLHDGSMKDQNGWPYSQDALTNESSPRLYEKSAQANYDLLRSIRAAGGPPPVPWISYPSYIGKEVWADTIKGAYALGVREFLYWNPKPNGKSPDPSDDAFAAAVFRELQTPSTNTQETGAPTNSTL